MHDADQAKFVMSDCIHGCSSITCSGMNLCMFAEDCAPSSSLVSAANQFVYASHTLSSTLTWIEHICFSGHHAGRRVEADNDDDCDKSNASLVAA